MQSAGLFHGIHSIPQPPPFNEFDDHSDFRLPQTSQSWDDFLFQPLHTHHHGQASNSSAAPLGVESMDLFSRTEQDDMFDFLRDFDSTEPWEFNPMLPSSMPSYPIQEEQMLPSAAPERDHSHHGSHDSTHSIASTAVPDSQTTPQAHNRLSPTGSMYNSRSYSTSTSGTNASTSSQSQPQPQTSSYNNYNYPHPQSPSQPLGNNTPHHHHSLHSQHSHPDLDQTDFKSKQLLSGPQKRINHVKSEKRRRDTIREGYLTLTRILSPSGPGAQQLAIPRRGRPKGSGRAGSGKKSGKGKSGVLFRAVEYIRFMEESCQELEKECLRLEAMTLVAGHGNQPQPQLQYGMQKLDNSALTQSW